MTQSAPLAPSVLEALARYDTPTICNAMEIVAPERRVIGFTVKPPEWFLNAQGYDNDCCGLGPFVKRGSVSRPQHNAKKPITSIYTET